MLEAKLAQFSPHHMAFRRILINIFVSITSLSAISYLFSKSIAEALIRPLFIASPEIHKLVYTSLPEAFIAYIKLSILSGVLFSFPFVLFQIWTFVAPGLRESEKRFSIMVVFWATILFASGAFFSFTIIIPKMLHYFMSYAGDNLEPLPKLGKYLTFIARTVLTFGLAFEIPFLMVMAGKGDFVKYYYFQDKRMWFYTAIIILAFLLSAGDFMATGLLAIPLFLLYESGIFLMKIFCKNI